LALKSSDHFFGWLAVGRVSLSLFSNNDAELESLLLANQTAFNLSWSQQLKSNEESYFSLAKIYEAGERPLPNELSQEVVGKESKISANSGLKVHAISAERVFVVTWSFGASARSDVSAMSECLLHYVNLLASALRMSGQSVALDHFAVRFSADIGFLLERMALTVRFDHVKISSAFIDLRSGESQECIFGSEQLSFSGSSRVERELLLELNGVLRLDKLVYRERRRILTGGRSAWMFSYDSRLRMLIPQFSQPGFLDEYVNLRGSRGLDLSRVLGNGELPDGFSAVALLFESTMTRQGAA
jgi:hypothetical protein